MPFICIALILFLDRSTKLLVLLNMFPGESVPVVKNVLHLTLVFNTGGAFGILASRPSFFFVVSVSAIVVLSAVFFSSGNKFSGAEKFALLSMIAGSAGNLIDRFFYGHVIDFIDLRVWPVFNVADSFITLGAALFVVSSLVKRR